MLKNISATRYHDFSCGHRVVGHEGKCAHLHGHNYRVHFSINSIEKNLDDVGRVLDFSVIKNVLCEWIEEVWDHKFLIWEKDPIVDKLKELDPDGICVVGFNPTAENMGIFLMEKADTLLEPYGCYLSKVIVEETRKCSVEVKQ